MKPFKIWLSFFVLVFISSILLSFFIFNHESKKIVSPLGEKDNEKPLEKYAFANLKQEVFKGSKIDFTQKKEETNEYSAYFFSFLEKDNKKVTGLSYIPKDKTDAPVILLIRGYVDREIYQPGVGSEHAAEYFAKSGYLTLAPDFLGYGYSDMPSLSPLEERFQTYTTILSLLASVKNLNEALKTIGSNTSVNPELIGIWGHSNGGQVALSVLEISSGSYPTVLWAPVSKPFPYSILYFTDEFDDHGKTLRKLVADFEKDYDIEKYSNSNFYSWIKAPIQLHQGGKDEEVPRQWSDDLYEKLTNLEKNVSYFVYPNQDHNFSVSEDWNTAIARSLAFFNSYLNK